LSTYRYKAKNLQGKVIDGEMNVANEAELRAAIRGQGYFMVNCEEVAEEVDLLSSVPYSLTRALRFWKR
jgi:type II secretory pathway component PulF